MNSKRGITLIALIITIIVLIILAAVSISLLVGENGLLTKASESRDKTTEEQEKEEISLAYGAAKMDDYSKMATKDQIRKVQYCKFELRDVL